MINRANVSATTMHSASVPAARVTTVTGSKGVRTEDVRQTDNCNAQSKALHTIHLRRGPFLLLISRTGSHAQACT
jgi:hypothetical protein